MDFGVRINSTYWLSSHGGLQIQPKQLAAYLIGMMNIQLLGAYTEFAFRQAQPECGDLAPTALDNYRSQ